MFKKIFDWYFTKNALPYWIVLLIDCLICYFAGIFVFWLYYHGVVTFANLGLLSKTILIYMTLNLIGFRIFRTYSGIIRYSSLADIRRVTYAMLFSLILAEIIHYFINEVHYPFVHLEGRQIIVMYIFATIGMSVFRLSVKSLYDLMISSKQGVRTLIYGIQEGGLGLARNLENDRQTKYCLKGFIAHDSTFKGRVLMGTKVYSVNEKLSDFLKSMNIQAVLVSPIQIDRFRADMQLQDILLNAGVNIYLAQRTREWSETDDDLSHIQLQEVKIEDLLPRDEISVDMNAIESLLKGKRIMITGSAGSIGAEMVKQVAAYEPSELILVDQAETPQHDIRLMLNFNFPHIEAHTIVASIANYDRMEMIFSEYKPEFVFHAAAYKHVPMMENNPSESIQNNILGTKVLADLSVKSGVKKFVMISTDKAVNPTNVMGCSKRICEIYCQSLNAKIKKENSPSGTQFVTTRFGNVLGSNGSVIPLFTKQIKSGGPVTVTDPNIIRFFMLIPEACKLVLEAGTHGNGGEIFVFDMGKPVRIADLAMRMIKLAGAKGVKIKYTGLRPGEKLYEEVLSTTENTLPSFNKKIRIAKVKEYDYDNINRQVEELIKISHGYNNMDIVRKMKAIVPEYISNNSVYSVLDKEGK